MSLLIIGRCCRVGQIKPTRFRVLWVAGEPQDQAAHDANKLRMTEAQALTVLEPKRIQKGVKRKRTDNQNVEIIDLH